MTQSSDPENKKDDLTEDAENTETSEILEDDGEESAAPGDTDADPGTLENAGTEEPEEEETDTSQELAAALGSAGLVAAAAPSDANAAPVHDERESEVVEEHHDEEEEASRSFASRVLTWLLLLIAGGGIALWGAPKIAPELPDGLGPVKAWLMPGELQSRAQIAELEASVDARLSDLQTGIDEDAVREIASAETASLAEAQAALEARITEISDQLATADAAGFDSRLSQIETRIEGLSGRLDGLTNLPSGENLSEEQAAEIAAFASTVEGLRAELGSLADQQGTLASRVEDVEAAIETRLQRAEEQVAAVTESAEATRQTTLARAALARIEAALAAGEPFEESLADFAAQSGMDAPEALQSAASTGIETLGSLRSSFPDAAHQAIRADIRAEEGEGSVGGRLVSYLEAQVASRSLTPQEGDSTDAVLSRAEDALRRDNLAEAIEELSALPENARAAMDEWISAAQSRVSALTAYSELQAAAAAQN